MQLNDHENVHDAVERIGEALNDCGEHAVLTAVIVGMMLVSQTLLGLKDVPERKDKVDNA